MRQPQISQISVFENNCEAGLLYIEVEGIYRRLTLTCDHVPVGLKKLYLETDWGRVLLGTPWPEQGKLCFQKRISEKTWNDLCRNNICKALLLDGYRTSEQMTEQACCSKETAPLWVQLMATGCRVEPSCNGTLLCWRWLPGDPFPIPSLFCLTGYQNGTLFLRWKDGEPVATTEIS